LRKPFLFQLLYFYKIFKIGKIGENYRNWRRGGEEERRRGC
jgi:hypothetical protein